MNNDYRDRKKSYVGYTYGDWHKDFRMLAGDIHEARVRFPDWVLKRTGGMKGLKKIRITIEEV